MSRLLPLMLLGSLVGLVGCSKPDSSVDAVGVPDTVQPAPSLPEKGGDVPLPSRVLVSGLAFEASGSSLVVSRLNDWNLDRRSGSPGRLTQEHFRRLQTLLRTSNGVKIIATPRFAVNLGEEGKVEALREVTFPTAYTVLEGLDSHHPKAFGSTSYGFSCSVRPRISNSGRCQLELTLQNARFNGFQDLGKGMRVPVLQRLTVDTAIEIAWGEVLFFGGNQELATLKTTAPGKESPVDQGIIKTWKTGEKLEWREEDEKPPQSLFFLLQVRPISDLPKTEKA